MNTASSSAQSNTATSAVIGEDKTVAIVSYLTIIGFIVAIVMHGKAKTHLGAYHLRQSLGLIVCALAMFPAGFLLGKIPFLGALASFVIWGGFFVFWIIGLLSALNGDQKPLPVVGEKFQAWFNKAFL